MSTRTTARLRELLASEQPVFFPDCNTALAARVLEEEHRLYPIALEEYCRAIRGDYREDEDAGT